MIIPLTEQFLLSPLAQIESVFQPIDEASELTEKALNGEFPELSKKSHPMASKNPKKPAESTKINKKSLFVKNSNFI